MRIYPVWLIFLLLPVAPFSASAQTHSLSVCIAQDAEGYDALRLARQLSSRRLANGDSLSVVVITTKGLPAEEERVLTKQGIPFARVVLKDHTARGLKAENEKLGCDYEIKVWFHENVDDFDTNSPPGIPSPTTDVPLVGDRTVIGYELRSTQTHKVLARGAAPPLTIYVRQGRRVFNPYPLFANQIMKELNAASVRSADQ